MSDDSAALLIASWGRPGDWRNAVYANCDRGEKGEEACSSLVFMSSSVAPRASMVIFGLDSIIDSGADPRGSSVAREGSQNACARAFWDAVRELSLGGGCYSDYGDILDRSEKVYHRVVKELFQNLSGNIEIRILPALGRPGGLVKFDGDGRDFHSLGLLHLFKIVKNLEKLPRNIVLDLTHGINYMPALTLQIARDLSNLILMMSSREQLDSVKIEAYNADPFPRGREPGPRLCMNQIYREQVKYISVPHVVEKLLESRARIEDRLSREVRDINGLYEEYVVYLASSILYPMPLALALLCLEDERYGKLEEALERLPEIWREGVEAGVRKEDREECRVNRRLRILPKALYITLLSYLACRRVREIVRKEDVENLDGYPVVGVEALKSLGDSLYERISDTHGTIIGNELDKIVNESKNIGEGECKKLEELERFREEAAQRAGFRSDRGCPAVKRNLIAHAGLEKTVTRVCVRGGKKYVGYIGYPGDPRNLIRDCGLKIETYS